MGVVYKARQKRLDRMVALKILPPNVSRDAAFSERFTREAKALARLTHPNIVSVHDFGQTDGLFYFVMEFVDGMNLRQLLNTGRLSPKEALAIVPQICEALQFAHDKGIVHRDIKPENILIDKTGVVKIADFGLAKIVGLEAKDQTITSARDVIGTPHYMAPEQIEHPQDVDHRADIYSLGVVFYQMLTGELPIGRFAPPSRKVQIDVRLDEVVLRALEKEPEHRYQHASDVKTQVETIAQTEGLKIESRRSETDARFCGTAIAGACLMLLFFASAVFWDFGHLGGLQALVGVIVSTLGFVAIFGTTILGWVAVSQIRRSEGKLYGMGVAMFDGLIFPLLVLDAAVFGLAYLVVTLLAKLPYFSASGDGGIGGGIAIGYQIAMLTFIWLGSGTLFSLVADFLIIRRVWRAANPPVAAPASTVPKPDRFWRWFAVTVVALIASPFVIIALLVILTPLFIRFHEGRERAQRVNQQSAQHAAVEPAQQVLAESDGARFATTNSYIGQTWFPKGDSIEITSVERTQERMTVKGRYNLVSHDSAVLALYIKSTNQAPEDARQRMQISKGAGEFELIHPHLVPGLPHVSMYADGRVIVEGKGWGGFNVGATREELIQALGQPDSDSDNHWMKWERTHVHCLVDDARGAIELRFDEGFPGLTTAGIGIGSPLKDALAAYGEPSLQKNVGSAKELLWSSKGILIWFHEDRAAQIIVFQKTEQHAAAMPQEQVLAESDGARLATTDFHIGQTWFPKSDSIEITSVERTRDQMTVKGHYNLVSHDSALLALYVTTTNNAVAPEDTKQRLQISKGAGDFELIHPHLIPGLPHVSMYADGHPFAALYFGTKAEALEESQASWITNAPVVSTDAKEDLGQTVASSRPVVIETQPVSGATDVEPGISEIRVRFNKRMADGSWSWCTVWENSTPEFIGQPYYDADGRTCVAKAKLEPGRTYGFWINSQKFQNFTDRDGRPAVPYLLTFQTRPN